MAGQVILQGFMQFRISIFLRRLITMLPAIAVIAYGLDPLKTLVLSQAVLSFCLAVRHDSTARANEQKGADGRPRRTAPITNYLALVCDHHHSRHEFLAVYAIATGKT